LTYDVVPVVGLEVIVTVEPASPFTAVLV